MDRMKRKWTSLAVVITMLFSLLVPMSAYAAGPRIDITSPFANTNPTSGLPEDLNAVPRFTTTPIQITAGIQNIPDTQVSEIYYEITNIKSNPVNNVVTVVKSNPAQHVPGSFTITFNNVALTEGLNKIVIKMGTSSIVSSAPSWAYFTPTTNITNLTANGAPFLDTVSYPTNPSTNSTVTIAGQATNATSVEVTIGNSAPKTVFLNNGAFFFTADNKPTSTATFHVNAGDNPMTIVAKNSTKVYQTKKNLIYDDGNPYAFNAKITTDALNTYESLLMTPTTSTTNIGVSSNLKVDLLPTGNVKYRFIDIIAGGTRFGPYDLGAATVATTAQNNGLFPTAINEGYSPGTVIGIQGTGLNNSGITLTVTAADKNGTDVAGVLTAVAAPNTTNSTGTMAFFELAAGLSNAGSPYKITVSNGSTVLNNYSLVLKTAGTIPTVHTAAITSPLKAGYPASPEQVTLDGTASASATSLRVDITDLTGQNVLLTATATNADTSSSNTVFDYTLPSGLQAGMYKFKIYYARDELKEGLFTVGPADPTPPTLNRVTSTLIVSRPDSAASSYFSVQGKNLGSVSDIGSGAKLVDPAGTASDVYVTPYSSDGSTIIFKIDDTTTLGEGVTYALQFDLNVYDSAGGSLQTPFTVSSVVKAKDLTIPPIVYGSQTVTDIWPGNMAQTNPPLVLQVDQSSIATTPITVAGLNLADEKLMSVQIYSPATGRSAGSGAKVTSVDTVNSTASVTLPSNLSAGTYFLQFTYSGNVLAQYPITIANASLASLNPSLVYSNNWTADSKIVVTGTGFGLENTKLKLRFVSDSTSQETTQAAPVLNNESQATFSAPNLTAGTYTVSLLFNDVPTGAALKYTVAPQQSGLQENAQLSVKGKYKVYDFDTRIQIPTDRDQIVQFKFYNFVTDTLLPTTFSFHYVDSTLPYVDYSMIGQTQQLSELSTNTIGEIPNTLNVFTNTNASKVNLYIGTYTSSSTPIASIATMDTSDPAIKKAEFPLASLPNGATKFTIIPSNDPDVSLPSKGENISGKRVYDINITSTPYVIVNNVFTGMVVKDPISEITCTNESNILVGGCISGRFVNLPLNNPPASNWALPPALPSTGDANVEMYVNGIKSDLSYNTVEIDPILGTFFIPFDAAHGGPLVEGKNTIAFYLYVKGVLKTKSSFEIFVFSTTAPEFQTVKPIEVTDIPKYVPGKAADTYSTSETAISFSGQFLNATDLKLTVKSKDASGKQITLYDRRESSTTLPDPAVDNPGYLDAINFSVPPLSFTTFPINLSIKGDTIFEFTITNSSKVSITKTITVTREPLPYVIIYPALTKNSNGKDQANINSNYVEIEMAAENADSVNFGGKIDAVKRQVTDSFGNTQTHYFYEVGNLKTGANNVKFTIMRGTQKTNGTFILFNSNTNVEGAQFKTALKPSMKVYSGNLELKFPGGTNLMRNDPTGLNQYLTTDRKILFGIANEVDGRVDKFKNPSADDGQINNPYPLIPPSGKLLLSEPTGRFRPASSLYWIDAGTIPSTVVDTANALSGGGKLPYDTVDFFSRDIKDLVVPTKRGTLTLKYDPNIRSDAAKYITVYHYDIYEDYTGSIQFRWHNIGGVVDAAKNTITVPFDTFGYYQVMYLNQSFDDVTTHPWARNQLDTLYAKGIMVNKDTTDFVPNDNITRGEFSALLVKIFDIPLQYTETPTFADVLRVNPLTNGMYDYRYIETAARAGIVRGSGGGRFSPDSSITRQEAAVMIARAANLKLTTDVAKSLITLQKAFTDANGIDLYARTSVEAVNKAALIEGKQNVLLQGQKKSTFRYDPDQTFTRAEAAEVAVRVLRQQKKLPK